MRGLRRVNTATLEPWQRRNGEFESKLEYEIHGKFHEHERDVKGVDTTAWVALVDMLPAYENVDALSDAIDAFDEAMLEAREGELAALQAEEEAGGACGD